MTLPPRPPAIPKNRSDRSPILGNDNIQVPVVPRNRARLTSSKVVPAQGWSLGHDVVCPLVALDSELAFLFVSLRDIFRIRID